MLTPIQGRFQFSKTILELKLESPITFAMENLANQNVIIAVLPHHEDLHSIISLSASDAPVFSVLPKSDESKSNYKFGKIDGVAGTHFYYEGFMPSDKINLSFNTLGTDLTNHPNRKLKYRQTIWTLFVKILDSRNIIFFYVAHTT